MILDNTRCCGFNLGLKKITFLGIFTFSLPLLILGSTLFLLLIIPSRFIPSVKIIKYNLGLLLKVNYYLINSTLNLRTRCILSGKIFSYSPLISGLVYKYFNLFILFLLWLGIIIAIRILIKAL